MMTKPALFASVTLALAVMLSPSITGAQAAPSSGARAAAAEAWKLVPVLSTQCFTNDGFDEKLVEADRRIAAALERQEAANEPVIARFQNMDMSEKMQRMQGFMMKNPEAAMKMMSGAQALGASAAAEIPEASAASDRLDMELKALEARFKQTLAEAAKPALAKQTQWVGAKTVPVGEVGAPMFTNAADHAHYTELVAEENAAVEKACTAYFGAGGQVHQWIERYRSEVIDKVLAMEVANDEAILAQMQAMELPSDGFRPAAPLKRAGEFVRKLSMVYGMRPAKSEPRIGIKR